MSLLESRILWAGGGEVDLEIGEGRRG